MLTKAIKNFNCLLDEYTDIVLSSKVVPVSKELKVLRDSVVRDRLKEVQETNEDKEIKRKYIKALIITFLIDKPVPFLSVPYPKSWFYEFLLQGIAAEIFSNFPFRRIAGFLRYTKNKVSLQEFWPLMFSKVQELKIERAKSLAEDYEVRGYIAYCLERLLERISADCLSEDDVPKGGLGFLGHLEQVVDEVNCSVLQEPADFQLTREVFLRCGREELLKEKDMFLGDTLFLEQLTFSPFFFSKVLVNDDFRGDFTVAILYKHSRSEAIYQLSRYLRGLFALWIEYVNRCSVLSLKELMKAVSLSGLKNRYWVQVGGMMNSYVLIPSRNYLKELIKTLMVLDKDLPNERESERIERKTVSQVVPATLL